MPGCLSSLRVITVCMTQPPSKEVGLKTFVILFGAGCLLASPGRKSWSIFKGSADVGHAGSPRYAARPHEQIALQARLSGNRGVRLLAWADAYHSCCQARSLWSD